ncbi:unnamed protein product [Nesidiocoris tenuis]|uniref:Uncharacterized protein n=1 Tax=Nesidiocoris tenuis TaxID=355587 RepID=A0A6H5HKF0_9HEMI|nr:unnamed protein product [Nesidiocoris tenuis]
MGRFQDFHSLCKYGSKDQSFKPDASSKMSKFFECHTHSTAFWNWRTFGNLLAGAIAYLSRIENPQCVDKKCKRLNSKSISLATTLLSKISVHLLAAHIMYQHVGSLSLVPHVLQRRTRWDRHDLQAVPAIVCNVELVLVERRGRDGTYSIIAKIITFSERKFSGYDRIRSEYDRTTPDYDRTSADSGRTLAGSGRTPAGSGRTSAGSGRTTTGSGRTTTISGRSRSDYDRTSPDYDRTPAGSGRIETVFGRNCSD